MTRAEGKRQFGRLKQAGFRLPDADEEAVFGEWYSALSHFAVEAVDRAITELKNRKVDTFWPSVGELRETIRVRLSGLPAFDRRCETCHGTTWVDAEPYDAHGQRYACVRRCPDCGVPAPVRYHGEASPKESGLTKVGRR